MPKEQRKASVALENARKALITAQLALMDFKTRDTQAHRDAGVRQFVFSIRTVPWIIKTLEQYVEGFKGWYDPLIAGLMADPVFHYFTKLRNALEKEGELVATQTGMHFEDLSIDFARMAVLQRNAPPGAVVVFGVRNEPVWAYVFSTPGRADRVEIFTPADNPIAAKSITRIYRFDAGLPPELASRSVEQLAMECYQTVETWLSAAASHLEVPSAGQ